MKYHIIKSDGTKVQLSDHQIQYAYFLAGFQNEVSIPYYMIAEIKEARP